MMALGKLFQHNLFVYCLNTPSVYYDPSGQSPHDFFADMLDTWLNGDKRFFWSSVCMGLTVANLKYSALLLENSNKRNPDPMTFGSSSDFSKKISNDEDFMKGLREAITNGKDSFSVEFKKDKDLMGSIHKSDCSIISIDHHQNGIAYSVELIDDYNFTEFRTDYLQDGLFNAIAWIGNDLAHIDMNAGVLNSYPLIIRIEGILP